MPMPHLPGIQARIGLAILCLLLARPLCAEPVGTRILDEVRVQSAPHHAVVTVRFTTAMQVLEHFPREQGRELRIRLRPALVPEADRQAIPTREALQPDNAAAADLIEVSYEGDMTGGPFLVLEFERPVEFAVLPGPDTRGLQVVVLPLDPCTPEPNPSPRNAP